MGSTSQEPRFPTPSDSGDAHFTIHGRTGPLCDTCGRGPKRHTIVRGEGQLEGWIRYQCKIIKVGK